MFVGKVSELTLRFKSTYFAREYILLCKHSIAFQDETEWANTFALQNPNYSVMASSEDFQSIDELYKKQGIPKGISIVNFCRQNGIVYSQLMEMPMYSCLKTVKRLRLYDSKIIRDSFMISLMRKVISSCNQYLKAILLSMDWILNTWLHCLNVLSLR